MSDPAVTVVLRVRQPDGTRTHHTAVLSPNGRLKGHYGLVGGRPTHLPNGIYYLRFREQGRRKWQRAGSDPASAMTAKLKREHQLAALNLGLEASSTNDTTVGHEGAGPVPSRERHALLPTIHAHCRDISLMRDDKTAKAYEFDLTTFAKSCGKHFLEDLTRTDVQQFVIREKSRGMSPKTIANRLITLKAFLRKWGADGKIVDQADAPRVHKKLPHVYSREQVRALLTESSAEDRLIWEVFLAAGLRERELSFLCWEDVNFELGWLHLRAKPELGFKLKDAEERQVPLPAELMIKLKARREARGKDRFVFPTDTGKPDGHLLRRLKQVVYEADLNCQRCVNRAGVSCKTKPVCGQWTLHSFRRTCATRWHEAGLSVPSVQRLLGHADIETTMSYLSAQDFGGLEFRASIDGAFAKIAA